jgi:hypothetical protein
LVEIIGHLIFRRHAARQLDAVNGGILTPKLKM